VSVVLTGVEEHLI